MNPPQRSLTYLRRKDLPAETIALARYLIGSVDVPTYQYRCKECGKSFERTVTIDEHEKAKARCPKCDSQKVTQVPGRVHVVTSKKS